MFLYTNSEHKISRSALWTLWGPILLIPTAFAISATAVPFAFAAGWFWLGDNLLGFLRQFCHQMASRSFWIWGYPFGLCIRCLAIYTTFSIFGSSLALGRSKPLRIPVALGLILPMFVDLGLQGADLWSGDNLVRGSTGALFAIGSASLFWTGMLRVSELLPTLTGVNRIAGRQGRMR